MFEDAEEIQQSEEAAARLRQLRIENSNGHCEGEYELLLQ